MKKVTVVVPEELHKRLRMAVIRAGRTIQAEILESIEATVDMLEEEEPKAQEASQPVSHEAATPVLPKREVPVLQNMKTAADLLAEQGWEETKPERCARCNRAAVSGGGGMARCEKHGGRAA